MLVLLGSCCISLFRAISASAVNRDKLFHGEEAAADPQYNRFPFQFHEDLLPVEFVNSRCLSLKIKLAAEADGRFID